MGMVHAAFVLPPAAPYPLLCRLCGGAIACVLWPHSCTYMLGWSSANCLHQGRKTGIMDCLQSVTHTFTLVSSPESFCFPHAVYVHACLAICLDCGMTTWMTCSVTFCGRANYIKSSSVFHSVHHNIYKNLSEVSPRRKHSFNSSWRLWRLAVVLPKMHFASCFWSCPGSLKKF